MRNALAALAGAAFLLFGGLAQAQIVDQCATTPNPADGAAALVQRLRCTIQVLDAERMQAEDAKTDAEVGARIAQGKVDRLAAELNAAKAKPRKLEIMRGKK